MDGVLQDLRFAIRGLIRHRGFALVAAVTIALGIGITTAIFSAINGVLLEPLPYPGSDRLVVLNKTEGGGQPERSMSQPDLRDIQSTTQTFEALVGYGSTGMTLTGLGKPERISGVRLTDPMFRVFGVQPILGRDVTRADAIVDGPNVIVIGYDFWQTRLQGDPEVLGRALELNGSSWEVVGVAPEQFDFPGEAEFWTPWHLDPEDCGRGCHTMLALGRLAEDADLEATQNELDVLSARLRVEYPVSNHDKSFHAVSLHETIVGDVRAGLWIMLGAVTLVLLIACANVANLLLVRSTGRATELGVRGGLGASRGRLIQQLLTESLVLAAVGGALGLGTAHLGVRGLRLLAPDDLPRVEGIVVDGTVLGFAAGLVLVVSLLFGLAPAIGASRASMSGVLAGARAAGRIRGSRYRSTLLVLQTGLSLVLLLGAGLLTRSFGSLYSEELGYTTEGVLTFNVSLPGSAYPADERVRFFLRLDEELASIPGVIGAGSIFGRPLGGNQITASTYFLDRPPVPEGHEPGVLQRIVTPGYFEAMNIPLIHGRGLTPSDHNDESKVALVNQRLVDVFYPDSDPLGKQFEVAASWGYPEDEPRTIVGVVADHRSLRMTLEPEPEIFIPQSQFGASNMSVIVRTAADAAPALPAARARIGAMDPNLPLVGTRTMEEVVSGQLATPRFFMLLLVLFSGFSLLLAAVGLYGVVAYAVSRRTREIGVRMALGARAGDIVGLTRRQAIVPAVSGLIVGLLGGLAGSRVLESMLYEVGAQDPVTVVGATLGLAVIVFVSTTLPARRATRIAPASALRRE